MTKLPEKTVVPNKTEQIDELKDAAQSTKYPLSKFEYDLYHDEDNVAEKVIRVKATYSVKKGDRWRIFSDNKLICMIDGSKLTKKERTFLKTVDGFNWLLKQAKSGIKSFNFIKNEIKKKIAVA